MSILSDIEGIGDVYVAKLQEAGVSTLEPRLDAEAIKRAARISRNPPVSVKN